MIDERTEAAVLASFDALVEALCVRRDAEDALGWFADEDDAVMWGSGPNELAVGKTAIGELFRTLLAPSPAPFEFRWDFRHLRVAGDVAWINAAGVAVDMPGDGSAPAPYRLTAVLVYRAGTWRWHTFSGSEPVRA